MCRALIIIITIIVDAFSHINAHKRAWEIVVQVALGRYLYDQSVSATQCLLVKIDKVYFL